MHILNNNQLSVSILDPIVDQDRLGSRYVTGGYIYQVRDEHKRALLGGPMYPNPLPDVFDGQGAPDMFFTALMAPDTPIGAEVGCIGVGRVLRSSPVEPFSPRNNRTVLEYVKWDTDLKPDRIEMRTTQTFMDWGYSLTRVVELRERTVHSLTSIRNTGQATLPIRWFAHPFFPLTRDTVMCRFNPQIGMPENPGYVLNEDGYICLKSSFDWRFGGHFQPLDILEQKPLEITQKHPLLGQVITRTDFVPGFMPIWANSRTFSFEPYFVRELPQGESAQWVIEYLF